MALPGHVATAITAFYATAGGHRFDASGVCLRYEITREFFFCEDRLSNDWSDEEADNPILADDCNFYNGPINCRQNFSMRLRKR
jgi:hypothetical protein